MAIAAACLLPVLRAADSSAIPGVSAKAYIVVDDTTGYVLAGEHANDKVQVASLTKIATAVVVLDWVRLSNQTLDAVVTVPAAAVAEGGANNPVGFQAGDEISVRDLLYAALLQSDNIAANTLADFAGRGLLHPGPTEGEVSATSRSSSGATSATVRFVAEMNALARSLHMEHTRFLNPSGLDATEKPFSTAADLARLTRTALGKADFRFYIAQKERHISYKRAGQNNEYLLRNTNELLGTDRIDGVKTGQTSKAGQCLIISAARDSIVRQVGTTSHITARRIIVVILNSTDRFHEGSTLMKEGVRLYDEWAAKGYSADPKQML